MDKLLDKPLVSFCVMCYNQEIYIEEGLKAALAQTYEPLEVIVSDDGSIDKSWEIINRVAKEYKGPHKIILNRNETNLNLIKNFQKLCSLSSGELIIKADGDDVSCPNRAETLVEDWLATGKKALVMCSYYDSIDKEGNVIATNVKTGWGGAGWDPRSPEDFTSEKGGWYLGATMAISRKLYDCYSTVDYPKAYDDKVYLMRALFYDNGDKALTPSTKVRVIPKRLVRYRYGIGQMNVYGRGEKTALVRSRDAHLQALMDYNKSIWSVRYPDLKKVLEMAISEKDAYYRLVNSDSFFVRLRAWFIIVRYGVSLKKVCALLLYMLPYSLQLKIRRIL